MFKYSNLKEFFPREGGQYGSSYNGAYDNLKNELTFKISDPRGFLKGGYIGGVFEAKATDNVNAPLQSFLDKGGINACIDQVIIKIGSAEIDNIKEYAKYYNVYKYGKWAEDFTDNMRFSSLDSLGNTRALLPNNPDGNFAAAGADKYEYISIRKLVMNKDQLEKKIRFTMHIMSDYLNNSLIPLPLLPSSLDIIVKFNDAIKSIVLREADEDVNNIIGFRITEPVFYGNLVIPTDQEMNEYITRYEGDGIDEKYQSVRSYITKFPANTKNGLVQIFTKASEAVSVCSVVVEKNNFTNNASNQGAESQSTFLKANMDSYRYRTGNVFFPPYREVMTDDHTGALAFEQLKMAMKSKMSSLRLINWAEDDYNDPLAVDDFTYTANKFIFAVPLSAYNVEFADLSTNELQFLFKKDVFDVLDDPFNDLILVSFVKYNVYIQYSRNHGVRVSS